MTSRDALGAFREVWFVDSYSPAEPGGRPQAACLAAREWRTGHTIRLGRDELRRRVGPPYPTDAGSLVVAFDAPGAAGCHLDLEWPVPDRVIDLSAEFANRINGLATPHGRGLYAALAWHGLDTLPGAARPRLDALAARGGALSDAEEAAILAHRGTRAEAIAGLLTAMLPEIDLGPALLRGRYAAAVARVGRAGVPIDVLTLDRLRGEWRAIQDALIRDVDSGFGVYDGRSFRADRWESYLDRRGIAWPRLACGSLDLSDDTFREMARGHAEVALMRELRSSLARLQPEQLAVGPDGRSRVALRPFASKTGRNQPSGSGFIFGPSRWLRGLIKPGPGRAVAYLDWSQQEFGIAAALSGDAAMIAAYRTGDPYLAFGVQGGAIPPSATKSTHGAEREAFKACALGVLYGMGAASLAGRVGLSAIRGRELIRLHRETYPRFWDWSDGVVAHAMFHRRLSTVFGWTLRLGPDAKAPSIRNFPCQANGAEMLRLACCLATERGISVVAPVHDALLIEGPSRSIDALVHATQEAMAEASAVVLDGFRLRAEARVVRWPDRYMDERGRGFWDRVMALLPEPGVTGRNWPVSA